MGGNKMKRRKIQTSALAQRTEVDAMADAIVAILRKHQGRLALPDDITRIEIHWSHLGHAIIKTRGFNLAAEGDADGQ